MAGSIFVSSTMAHLCSVCLQTLRALNNYSRECKDLNKLDVPHHRSVESLQRSVRESCWICYLLSEHWHREWPAALKNPNQIAEVTRMSLAREYGSWNRLTVGPDGCTTIATQKALKSDCGAHWLLELDVLNLGQGERSDSVVEPASAGCKTMLNGKSIPPESSDRESSTQCEASMATARQWLGQCVTTHYKCQRTTIDNWVPRRLLAVRGANDLKVYLTELQNIPYQSQYLALSYCWGDGNFLQLTKLSYESLSRGLPVAELPRTIQGAIWVTRRLGFEFIWIDALCMLQDQKGSHEWFQEALEMDKVYTHAHLTLAAMSAASPNDGMFRRRVLDHVKLDLPIQHGPSSSVLCSSKYMLVDDSRVWRHFRSAPLLTRAWAVQERFLAPRVLHFARDELFWDCREQHASETWPFLPPKELFHLWRGDWKMMEMPFKPCDPDCPSPVGCPVFGKWTGLIKSYSACQLTEPEDKLVALAGMARYLAPSFNCDYIAGLWERHLPAYLHWKVDRPCARPFVDRRPSYTWASVDAPVNFTGTAWQLTTLEVLYIGSPTFDFSKATYLRIRTKLCRLHVKPNRRARSADYDVTSTFGSERLNMISLYPDAEPDRRIEKASAADRLFVTARDSKKRDKGNFPIPYGIALECIDSTDGCFRRLGIVEFPWECDVSPAWQDDDADRFPCCEYDASKCLHTFILK